MAPEQISGDRLGPGTDLYALAVVLYELLAGRTLFAPGLSVPALLHHHLSVPPDPLPEAPPAVAEIVLACLAKDPAQRPASAHELAVELARAATGSFGADWLAGSAVPVRLPDDVLAAAGHLSSGSTPQPGWEAATAASGPPRASTPVPSVPPTRLDPGPGPTPPPTPPPAPAPPPTPPPTPPPAAATRRVRGRGRRRRLGVGVIAAAGLVAAGALAAVLAVLLGAFGGGGEDDEGTAPGTAYAGGPVEAPTLYSADGLAIGADGTLYVADPGGADAGQVLALRPDGTLSRVAGTAPPPPGSPTPSPPASTPASAAPAGGPATEAVLARPQAVAAGPGGSLFVVETGEERIRRLGRDGAITPFAGVGSSAGGGFTGERGRAELVDLSSPDGVAVDAGGNVYISDGYRIRKVTTDGMISTVAGGDGSGGAGDGGPAAAATLSSPSGIAVAGDGTVYVADDVDHVVRAILPTGKIERFAGTPGTSGYSGDGGPARAAAFYAPGALALGPDGALYVADAYNYAIRRIGPDGIVTTVAGKEGGSDDADGILATEARIDSPTAIAVDRTGALYIAQGGDAAVRRVGADGILTTVLRTPAQGH
jgi:serine/threonine-protein kinase